MSDSEFDDIPGTIVFDAERSRQGYHLNMFCMSLMKPENRDAFRATFGKQDLEKLEASWRVHVEKLGAR